MIDADSAAAIEGPLAARDQAHAAWAALESAKDQATASWFGVVANLIVVVAAFLTLGFSRWFQLRDLDDAEARLHVGVMKACSAAIQIYDAVMASDPSRRRRSRSDMMGRLRAMEEFVDNYARANLIDSGMVSLVVTTKTLLKQTIKDIESAPHDNDLIIAGDVAQINAMRLELLNGAKKMIEQTEQRPAYPRSALRWPWSRLSKAKADAATVRL